METLTKNGVTYTPTSNDAALTYDSSGNVTGISKGTVEVTLENSTNPKIMLDGSTAFNFTAEVASDGIKMNFDENSGGNITYSVTENNSSRAVDFEITGSVLFDAEGNISPLEGAVLTETFEDGNTLIVTANSDATNAINFPAENSLKFEPANEDDLTLNLIFSNNRSMFVDSIEGAISYVGDTIELAEDSKVSGNIIRDKLHIPVVFDVEGGTGYSKVQAEKMIYTVEDGATLNAINGDNEISMTAGTVTLALETDTTKIYLAEGTVMKGNSKNPVILETVGSYNMNGEEFTSTADNVEVYLTNFDTVEFESDAAIIYNGHTFDGKGSVKIVDGVLYFTMTEAGVLTLDERIFNLTENVPQGTTISLIENGFQVSRVISEEEVIANNWDPSDAGKTFTEIVEISNDDSYTIQFQANGIKQIDGISNGAVVQTSAIFDGEPDENGNYFTVSTDEVGTITLGDKTYTISNDDNVKLSVLFANDGTTSIYAIEDLEDEGMVRVEDSILSSGVVINSIKSVQIIGTDSDDTITNTGNNVTIYGNAGDDLITASGRNLSIDAGEGNDSLVAANSNVSISNSTINIGEGENFVDFAGTLNQVIITGEGISNDINIGTLKSPLKNSERTFNFISLITEDTTNISIEKFKGAGLQIYLDNTSGEGNNNVFVESFEGNNNTFFESVSGAVASNVVLGDMTGKNNFVTIDFGLGNANIDSNNDSVTMGDIGASNEIHMWLDGGNDNVTVGDVGKKVSLYAYVINSLTAEIGNIADGGDIIILGGNAENNITTGNLGASVSFAAELQDGNDNVKIGDVGKNSNVNIDGGGGADTFEFNDIYGNVTVTSGEPMHINRVDTSRNSEISAESLTSTAETNAIDLTISTVKANANVEITGGADADKVSIGFVELGNVSISLGAGNDSIYIDAVSDSVSSNESKVSVDAGEGDNYIKLDFGYKNTITSGSGKDLVEVMRGSNMNISTGAGNDTILGVLSTADLESEEDNWTFGSNAIIDGGAGNDYIAPHYTDNSSIFGGAGNDTIINNGANTTINGGAGNDYIELTNNLRDDTGDYEGQVIEASAGNDTIYGATSNTSIVGTFTSSSVSGDDVILTSAEGTLTIIDGKGETFYINGAETTIDENMTASNIENTVANILLEGTELNDTISNGGDNVTIDSGAGNDEIAVVADNVSINTGEGNNTVYGIESKQIKITTGDGDNYIYNTYVKYDEERQAYVNYDSDTASTIITGAGNDTIANEGMYRSSVDAGAGNNYLGLYHSYENTVTTGADDDLVIVGRGHKLSLMTGAGNDTIQGTLGAVESSDWAFGGYSTVDAGKGNDYIAPYYTDNSSIYGGAGNDTIIHNGKNTTINGGAGNDYIEFTNNYDTETRDYESAIFVASAGNDTIKNYSSVVTLQGTFKNSSVSGNDVVLKTSHGTLTILDGAGEILNINGVESIVGEKLAAQNINNRTTNTLISGTSLDDTIKNTAANVTIEAAAGDDSIKNSGSNAVIDGGAGDDKISLSSAAKNNTIYAGEGDDSIIGGGGNNLFVYAGGNDYISAYKVTDTLQIESGEISAATLSGSNVIFTVGEDNITLKGAKNKTIHLIDADGNSFSTLISGIYTEVTITDADQSPFKADRNALLIDASSRTEDLQITGNSKANTILGGSGSDTINGGGGNDSIFGNDGADILSGGAGNDSIYGGAAADTLTGGAGNDLFIYSAGKDIITDYTAGEDKIKISKGKISNTTYDGQDVIFEIGSGSLTVQDASGKEITIIDSSGNETTETYSASNVSARTLDLLYDNNFMTDDAVLDDITEQKYSVTDIQDNKVDDLAQGSSILAYSEDK